MNVTYRHRLRVLVLTNAALGSFQLVAWGERHRLPSTTLSALSALQLHVCLIINRVSSLSSCVETVPGCACWAWCWPPSAPVLAKSHSSLSPPSTPSTVLLSCVACVVRVRF